MKKLLIIATFAISSVNLYSQTVVTDPNSIAQRLLLATQQMDEMVEQKYKFIEQIELLKKQYNESKELRRRVEKVSNAIKKGHEIVGIMTEAEAMMQLDNDIRHSLLDKANDLSDETIMTNIDFLVKYAGEISNIVSEAKKAITDNEDILETEDSNSSNSNSSNSQKMTDAERIERLRQIKTDMHELHDKIAEVYYRLNRIQVSHSRNKFIHSLY